MELGLQHFNFSNDTGNKKPAGRKPKRV